MAAKPSLDDSQCLGCGFSALIFDGDECPKCGKVFKQAEFDQFIHDLEAAERAKLTFCVHCLRDVMLKSDGTCPGCRKTIDDPLEPMRDPDDFDARLSPKEHRKAMVEEIGSIFLKFLVGTVLGCILFLIFGAKHVGLVTFGMLGGLGMSVENMRNMRIHRHAWQSARLHEAFRKGRLPKRFVLFLRGFNSDRKTELRAGHFTSGIIQDNEETKMRKEIPKRYELLAIGDPKEGMRLGAKRFYCGDHEWQAVVEELLRKASFVIFRPSGGSFLDWELEQTIKAIHPHRVAVALHGTSTRKVSEFFSDHGERLGVKVDIPATGSVSGSERYLYFDANWGPRTVKAPLDHVIWMANRGPRTLAASGSAPNV